MAPGMGLEPMSPETAVSSLKRIFRDRLRSRLDTPACITFCQTEATGFNLTVTEVHPKPGPLSSLQPQQFYPVSVVILLQHRVLLLVLSQTL
jgi:hypothetical protein